MLSGFRSCSTVLLEVTMRMEGQAWCLLAHNLLQKAARIQRAPMGRWGMATSRREEGILRGVITLPRPCTTFYMPLALFPVDVHDSVQRSLPFLLLLRHPKCAQHESEGTACR